MKSIVALSTLPYYELLVDRIFNTMPASSVIEVSGMNDDDIVRRVSIRPLYSEAYWIIVECSPKSKTMHKLAESLKLDWVRAIFLCPYKSIYEEVQDFLLQEGIEFDLFNCYKTSRQFKIKYVQEVYSRINDGERLDSDMARYISARIQGYERQLESIFLLARRGSGLSKRAIDRLMPQKVKISLDNLWLTLFYGELKVAESVRIQSMISRYRYYSRPLLDSFNKFLEQWEEVYGYFITGVFNENTMMMFIMDEGKKVGITSEFVAKRWLSILSTYSYEMMLVFRMRFEQARSISSYSGYATLVSMASVVGRFAPYTEDEGSEEDE